MDLFFNIIILAIFAETTAITGKVFCNKTSFGKIGRRRVFVDTSVLMDGRILSIARSGFLGDEILIPRSVIRELQLLADGTDSDKRARARFGLDVINDLERVESAHVEIYPDDTKYEKVDERLLKLAQTQDGIIMTNDLNLIKVAATEKIEAININDLAQGLRSEYLPGDTLNVKIISVGSNPHQGIAYLADGTMVVVDEAEKFAGKNFPIKIEFVRYLQTNAGKMMFAKVISKDNSRKATCQANTKTAKIAGRKKQYTSQSRKKS